MGIAMRSKKYNMETSFLEKCKRVESKYPMYDQLDKLQRVREMIEKEMIR